MREKSRSLHTDSRRRWRPGDQVIVGMNRFQTQETLPSGLLRVDPVVRQTQISRLQKLRSERDSSAVAAALVELETVAEGTGNLMPSILAAVKKESLLGRFVMCCAASS